MSIFVNNIDFECIKLSNFLYSNQFENIFKKKPTPYHNSFLALKAKNFKLDDLDLISSSFANFGKFFKDSFFFTNISKVKQFFVCFLLYFLGQFVVKNNDFDFLNDNQIFLINTYHNTDKPKTTKNVKFTPLTIPAATEIFSLNTLDKVEAAIKSLDKEITENSKQFLSDKCIKIKIGYFRINEKTIIEYFLSPFTNADNFFARDLYEEKPTNFYHLILKYKIEINDSDLELPSSFRKTKVR